MRRGLLILLATGCWLLATAPTAHAVDTITLTETGGQVCVVSYNWTSDGSGNATGRTSVEIPGVLFSAALIPSDADVPSANYDVAIKQVFNTVSGGVSVGSADLAGGDLANRSNSAAEVVKWWPDAVNTISGMVQIEVTNAGNAKRGRVEIAIARHLAMQRGDASIPMTTGGSGKIAQWRATGQAKWVDVSGDATMADGGALSIDSSWATDVEVAAAVAAAAGSYQPLDSDLTAIAALTTTVFGRGLLDDADAAAGRTSLGVVIGTNVQAYDADLTTYAGITPSANVQSLLGAADYSAMRTLLGLVIGTNVQAYDADLTTYAGITPSANVQSLLGAADYSAMRTLLGLAIGTNVQAYDADLTTYAGITPSALAQAMLAVSTLTSNGVLYGNGTSAVQATTAGASNSVLVSASGGAPSFSTTPRINALGVGTAAPANTGQLSATYAVADPTANATQGNFTTLGSLTGASSNSYTALFGDGRLDQAGNNQTSGGPIGVWGRARGTGSSGTVNQVRGGYFDAVNSGAGTLTGAYSLYSGTISNSGGGAITTAYGLYLANQSVGTSNVQLYLAQSSTGSNNWALYQPTAGVKSFFNGYLGVGTSTAAYPLHVVGESRLLGAVSLGNLSTDVVGFAGRATFRQIGSTGAAGQAYELAANTGDVSSPYWHNGTAWTKLAYMGEVPDGLFGTQVGSTLSTERTTTAAAFSQVTGTGIAVAVTAGLTEIIVEYESHILTDNGDIEVVLGSTSSTQTMVSGVTYMSGTYSDAGTMRSLSPHNLNMTDPGDASYIKRRCHLLCTRLAAGTYYVNIWFQNDSDGSGGVTYIRNIAVYTN